MRTRIEFKKIELWSLFKIAFFLYALIGLIVGLFYAVFMLIAGGLEMAFLEEEDFAGFGLIGGIFGIILAPFFAVLYGAMGAVFITIGGWIYNVVAGIGGGLKFETEAEMAEQAPAIPPAPPEPEPEPGGPIT